jgi:hypothetical protein
MFFRFCMVLVSVFLLGSAAGAYAQTEGDVNPESTPSSASAVEATTSSDSDSLTEEDLKQAQRLDSLTIPTPGELLAGITKTGKPDWQSGYREPIPTTYTSRPQLAMNLGGLIADGFLAVEAADSQRVKNTGKDIIELAKSLAVSQDVLGRANSIADFAEQNEWSTLKEELEATQNEVKMAMENQGDHDLVILVSLGGWIRGTEIVTDWISHNYTPESAKLLRQPAIVEFMRGKVSELPEKVQEDKLVTTVSDRLQEIQEMVSFPADSVPTLEDVQKLESISSELMAEISKKE